MVFHGRVSCFFRASESDVRQLFRIAVLAGFWVGRARQGIAWVLCMVGVATSTEPLSKPVACPAGVCLLASSFFTASESNVREF